HCPRISTCNYNICLLFLLDRFNFFSHFFFGYELFSVKMTTFFRQSLVFNLYSSNICFHHFPRCTCHIKYTTKSCINIHKDRSEEHTSELQSRFDLVCRLLLEKKKDKKNK